MRSIWGRIEDDVINTNRVRDKDDVIFQILKLEINIKIRQKFVYLKAIDENMNIV